MFPEKLSSQRIRNSAQLWNLRSNCLCSIQGPFETVRVMFQKEKRLGGRFLGYTELKPTQG